MLTIRSPAGKWSQRHTVQATALSVARGHQVNLSPDEKKAIERKASEKEAGTAVVQSAEETDATSKWTVRQDLPARLITISDIKSEVDVAVNEHLTLKSAAKILSNPLTWLPALSYLTSFGYELCIDSFLVNYLYGLFRSGSFTQLDAGLYTSTFGFLNIVTRPAGGFIADAIYKRYGVPGKKYWMLFTAGASGLVSIGLGVYIEQNTTAGATGSRPELAVIMGLVSLLAIFNEMANGANFALVPRELLPVVSMSLSDHCLAFRLQSLLEWCCDWFGRSFRQCWRYRELLCCCA